MHEAILVVIGFVAGLYTAANWKGAQREVNGGSIPNGWLLGLSKKHKQVLTKFRGTDARSGTDSRSAPDSEG